MKIIDKILNFLAKCKCKCKSKCLGELEIDNNIPVAKSNSIKLNKENLKKLNRRNSF